MMIHAEQLVFPTGRHRFQATLNRDCDGRVSIHATHYPGVISFGDTAEQAKQNIADAFLAMLEARKAYGEDMHYSQQPVVGSPPDSTTALITATK